MKKCKLALTSLLIGSTALVVPLSFLTSCNKPAAWDPHFEPATEEQKTKKLEDGSTTASYELTLANEVEEGEELEGTPVIVSKSSEELTIDLSNFQRDGKKVTFDAQLGGITNSEEKHYSVVFDINMACKKEETTSWSGVLSGFKLDVTIPASQTFTLSAKETTAVNNTSISVDTATFKDDEEFTVSVNNNRGRVMKDASITFTIGSNTVADPINEISASPTIFTKNYNRTYINALLTAASKPILKDGDHIEVNLVRVDALDVDTTDNSNRLRKCDINGNWSDVPDTKLSSLEGKVIIYDKTNLDYDTYDGTLAQFMARQEIDSEHTIYLAYGNYEFGQPALNTGAYTLKVNGIKNSLGEKQAAVYSYKVGAVRDPESHHPSLSIPTVNFELNDIKVHAVTSVDDCGDFYFCGFIAPALKCNYCDFDGAFSLYTQNATFDHCTFDSTNIYSLEGQTRKNEYPMWIYSNSYGKFTNCTFNCGGKGVKIFSEGETTTTNTFEDCHFELDQSKIGTDVEKKYPIMIDGSNLGSGQYTVYITRCTYSSNWKEIKQDSIYSITGGHTTVYESQSF